MTSAFRASASPEHERERTLVADDSAIPARRHARAHEHAVQFYDDEPFLATVVSEFLAHGIGVESSSHRHRHAVPPKGVLPDAARARRSMSTTRGNSGQLTVLDARQTLKKISVDEEPDARRFLNVIGSVIEKESGGS